MVITNLKPRNYLYNEVNRICNREQQTFYIDSGVFPIDMYTSYDTKNNRKIIVMIFDRESTKELYAEWKNRDRENNK
jgi:hypothetical protein